MRLHFIRNATLVIEVGSERVLVDPVLGPKGSLPPYALFLEFVRLAPGAVVANHLEALNHCPITRDEFRKTMAEAGLAGRTRVPDYGEVLAFCNPSSA